MVLACALVPASAASQTWGPEALQDQLGFTEGEWKEVDGGGVVAKTLKTRHGREVAVLGAARARASTACFLEEFQDIERFKKSPVVLQVHKFGEPPGLGDLEKLALDERDAAALRECRPGKCGLRLPAQAMESIRGAGPEAATAFRQWLAGYVEAYLASGNAALAEYHDKSAAVRLVDEFRSLLDATPGLAEIAPEFHAHLARYPTAPLPDVSGFLYWSRESFGLKPVASVTHVSIYSQTGQAILVSKQIYASHYFDGSLGLTFLADTSGSMHIVYLNRSRIDLLSGFLGGVRRLVLRGRLLDGFRQNLRDLVARLNSKCGQRAIPER